MGDTHRIAPHCHSALKPFSAPGRARKYASTSASSIATSHERDPPILRDEIGQGMTRLAQRGRFAHLRTAGRKSSRLHAAAAPAAMRVLCEKFDFTTYRPLSSMARTVNHPFPHQRGTEHLGPMRMAPFGDAASIDAANAATARAQAAPRRARELCMLREQQ